MTTQYNNNLKELITAEQFSKGRSVMWEDTQDGRLIIKVEGGGVEAKATFSKELMENLKGDASLVVGAICATIDEDFERVEEKKKKEQKSGNGNQIVFSQHLADGRTIEKDTPFTEADFKYDDRKRQRLYERGNAAIRSDRWTLHIESDTYGLRQQVINYINDATDFKFYEDALAYTPNYSLKASAKPDTTAKLIYFLAAAWLRENPPDIRIQNGQGGGWSCGAFSGLWADFSIQVKADDDFAKKHYCPFKSYFMGVRIVMDDEAHVLFSRTEAFKIVRVEFSYEPFKNGKTTVLMPTFGEAEDPFFVRHYKFHLAKLEEEAKERRREEKRLAHEAFLAEQRERERAWRARLEADLAATIVAYNAEEENLKKVIRFNREKVAEPLAKRIEAKEAERHREEAERRHAEKMKQKEAERLAKFAPKRK